MPRYITASLLGLYMAWESIFISVTISYNTTYKMMHGVWDLDLLLYLNALCPFLWGAVFASFRQLPGGISIRGFLVVGLGIPAFFGAGLISLPDGWWSVEARFTAAVISAVVGWSVGLLSFKLPLALRGTFKYFAVRPTTE